MQAGRHMHVGWNLGKRGGRQTERQKGGQAGRWAERGRRQCSLAGMKVYMAGQVKAW